MSLVTLAPRRSAPAKILRQYELVDRVRSYNPNADEDLLNRAYVYAMKAHGAQVRASGDPYFSHPLEVAAILTDLKLDDATIVAAVLHDTIEDTEATREEIDGLFGDEIGGLVEGLTKIKRLDLVSKEARQGENLRKLLLAIADDIRVLLVKLADRLHNMRTLHYVPVEKRARIAQETLDIYAPLSGRMGMQGMRNELEELAFKALMPEAHDSLVSRLGDMTARYGSLIGRIEKELTEKLGSRGIEAKVKGRQKQPYSVWHKMEQKSLALEQLSDIFGFRVLVPSVEDCYRVLGVVHTQWPCVPGRFKDYISTRSRTTTARCTRPSSARDVSGSSCRSARARCTISPRTASRLTRSTRTAGRSTSASRPARAAPIPGCVARSRCSPMPTRPRIS